MSERKLNRVSSLTQLKVDVTRTRNFRRVSSTDVQAKPRPRGPIVDTRLVYTMDSQSSYIKDG